MSLLGCSLLTSRPASLANGLIGLSEQDLLRCAGNPARETQPQEEPS